MQNSGKIIKIDISYESLKVAKRRTAKHKWANIELVNTSITDYESKLSFDTTLCKFALEIISDYKAAIDKIFNLLKPQGKLL